MRNRKRRVPLNHKKRRAASHVRGTTHQSSLVWFARKKTPHQNRDFPHRLAFICGVRGACLYALMPKTSQGQFLFCSCLFCEFRRSLPFLRVRQQSAGRACVCVCVYGEEVEGTGGDGSSLTKFKATGEASGPSGLHPAYRVRKAVVRAFAAHKTRHTNA